MVELSLRLIVMWSVPFNLNLADSFYSVWLVPHRRAGRDGWFPQMYRSRWLGGQVATTKVSVC